jgi:hypothetical protein
LVGSKDYSDVVFHVGNHALYAHRCIIESRCAPLFAVAVKDRGKKGHLTTLKTDEKLVDIRSLTLVLEYLYTGAVPFSDVTPAEVISLIAHSELYEIDRLRWLCERYLNSVLNHDLFFTLLLLSDVSGVARAKKLCLQYGALHFEELIVRKEQVHTLGIELFREFVVHSTLNHDVTEDLEQVTFPNTIREEFKIIFTAMQNPDAFFTFKSASTTVPCHKAVLFAQSERFKTLFLEDGPSVDGRYALPKNIAMPHEAFKSFLGWAYYRDTSFSAAHAAEMLPLAHDFGIEALIDECSSKLRKGISIQSVLPILGLCYSEWGKIGYKKELSQPCLDFVVLHFDRIDLSPLKSAAIAAAIAEAVRKAVIEGVWVTISGDSSSAPNGHSTPRHHHHNRTESANHEASSTKAADSEATTDAPLELDSSDRKAKRSKKRRTISIEPESISHLNGVSENHTEDSSAPGSPAPVDAASTTSTASTTEAVASKPSESNPPVVETAVSTPEVPAQVVASSNETDSKSETVTKEEKIEVVEKPTKEEKTSKPQEKKSEKAEEKKEDKKEEKKEDKKEEKKTESAKSTPRSERKNGSSDAKASATAASSELQSKSAKESNDGSSTPKAKDSAASKKSKRDSTAPPAEEVPVATETSEKKRPGLEPSTSVKAIKESFEAKGRHDEEEKVARERLSRKKSGQSSSDSLKASLDSPKVDRKQKS